MKAEKSSQQASSAIEKKAANINKEKKMKAEKEIKAEKEEKKVASIEKKLSKKNTAKADTFDDGLDALFTASNVKTLF